MGVRLRMFVLRSLGLRSESLGLIGSTVLRVKSLNLWSQIETVERLADVLRFPGECCCSWQAEMKV